jgi:uncharacterized protein YgbK (DUF1537 family)
MWAASASLSMCWRRVAPNPLVAIVGGQPNLGRYCVFANLFAAVSSGGSVVRIDRHPTMRAHPVTPMHEADLRVHLAAQGLARVVSIDTTTYELARCCAGSRPRRRDS